MTLQRAIAVEHMNGSAAAQAGDAFMPIYAEAFAEPSYDETADDVAATFRRFRSQTRKGTFRVALARAENGEPVGMAYGCPPGPQHGLVGSTDRTRARRDATRGRTPHLRTHGTCCARAMASAGRRAPPARNTARRRPGRARRCSMSTRAARRRRRPTARGGIARSVRRVRAPIHIVLGPPRPSGASTPRVADLQPSEPHGPGYPDPRPAGEGAPPGLVARVLPPGMQIVEFDDRVARHRDPGSAGVELQLDVHHRMLDDRPGQVQVHPSEWGRDLEGPRHPPCAAPLDPSTGGGNRGRCARAPLRERGQNRRKLAVRLDGEHLVMMLVHLLVRDAPFGVCLLYTLHGRVAVGFTGQ